MKQYSEIGSFEPFERKAEYVLQMHEYNMTMLKFG